MRRGAVLVVDAEQALLVIAEIPHAVVADTDALFLLLGGETDVVKRGSAAVKLLTPWDEHAVGVLGSDCWHRAVLQRDGSEADLWCLGCNLCASNCTLTSRCRCGRAAHKCECCASEAANNKFAARHVRVQNIFELAVI